MGREKLETVLDSLFAKCLTSLQLIGQCAEESKRLSAQGSSASRTQKLSAEIKVLRKKRVRVIDGFVEGAIGLEDRDRRLAVIDHDRHVAEDILARATPTVSLDVAKLLEALEPLGEWES